MTENQAVIKCFDGYEPEGREFESLRAHHQRVKHQLLTNFPRPKVAQLERRIPIQSVVQPVSATSNRRKGLLRIGQIISREAWPSQNFSSCHGTRFFRRASERNRRNEWNSLPSFLAPIFSRIGSKLSRAILRGLIGIPVLVWNMNPSLRLSICFFST
jgi:hypothetical protein